MQSRKLFCVFLISVFVLQACGGGGGSGGSNGGSSGNGLPPSIPTATVTGKAVDGLILNGTVSAYDYSKGTKGSLLGTATTDSNGNYNLTLQVESRPIMLVVTGGYYVEEASGTAVNLQPDEFMTALVNFKTGTPVTMAITPWTYVAAALANYNIGKGAVISTAIDAANKEISTVLGLDITTTIPADVTDSSNKSAILSPAIQYGWMSAAISTWTYGMTPAGTQPHLEPYTSIRFAQSMYDDVLHDGVLDGVGTVSYLSFGTTNFTTDTYRLGLAQAMLLFTANTTHNATSLTASQLLAAATKFANNGDAIWGGELPVGFPTPSIAISSPIANNWTRQTITVVGTVNDASGIFGGTIVIDGQVQNLTLGTASSGVINYTVDTTALTDGPHQITVNVTDNAGQESATMVNIKVDNTPPSLTVTTLKDIGGFSTCSLFGAATDNLSGITSLTISASASPATTATNAITLAPVTLAQNPLAGLNASVYENNPFDFLSSGVLQDSTAYTGWSEFDLLPTAMLTSVKTYLQGHASLVNLSLPIQAVLTDTAGNTTTVNGAEFYSYLYGCQGFAANP